MYSCEKCKKLVNAKLHIYTSLNKNLLLMKNSKGWIEVIFLFVFSSSGYETESNSVKCKSCQRCESFWMLKQFFYGPQFF